jgi:hypothetical protein
VGRGDTLTFVVPKPGAIQRIGAPCTNPLGPIRGKGHEEEGTRPYSIFLSWSFAAEASGLKAFDTHQVPIRIFAK